MQRVQRAIPGIVVVLIIAATMGYGFTASNTTPSSNAGFGSGEIDGYAVSNIRYTTVSGVPSVMSGVTFELDKPATTVQVVFPADAGGSGLTRPCAHIPMVSRPYLWTCAVLEHVELIERLEVAAAQ